MSEFIILDGKSLPSQKAEGDAVYITNPALVRALLLASQNGYGAEFVDNYLTQHPHISPEINLDGGDHWVSYWVSYCGEMGWLLSKLPNIE